MMTGGLISVGAGAAREPGHGGAPSWVRVLQECPKDTIRSWPHWALGSKDPLRLETSWTV